MSAIPQSSAAATMLLAQSVTKHFGNLSVLRGVDLSVSKGKVFCLIGSSGSGKSTFLRCINHLETIDGGRLLVDGQYVGYEERGGRLFERGEKALAAQRAQIGMVFQRFNLFPHLSVLDNITAAPLVHRRCSKAEAQEMALSLLERVGLRSKADIFPSELSGGQQQRVAIARTLAMRPKLLLFDEPTSALDPELVGEVLSVMLDLAREGHTMIVVTHEISFAREVADTLVFLDQGKVLESGPPTQLLHNPAHERTAAFLAKFR
ncbi:amino acid ABC transporter ATP-binding protein [Labrys okinawensis]|uniref:amino acid ABC transporter ATP-binding protein n=1 Tax=Labrys okinawensis TaxID=346911 RepID=UPI0039BC2DBC